MPTLQSLPTELIREILGHLHPITALHKFDIPEDARWDIRHWRRTLTALARTCRSLRDVAVPLLYGRYESAFDNPSVHFIDRSALHHSLRHVAVRTDGSTSKKYTPTPERIAQYHAWTDVSDWEPYGINDSDAHVADEAGQMELWRLFSRAPNLESLHVTAHSWLKHNQQGAIDRNPTLPPMWLSPVILAAQQHPSKTPYHGWFRHLHSLSLNLQNKCGTWLAPLFSLPSLQSLSLHSMGRYPLEEWTPTQNWPEMRATSSVRELGFVDVAAPADLIVRMISYCKTLQSFECDRASERNVRGYKDARQWCTDIVAGLQPYSQTLSTLVLFPWDRPMSHRLHIEYKRIPGFRTLVALKHLHVPWHTLMGSPECFQHEQDNTWESLGYWQYPLLRDVVPLNLHTLTTSVSDDALPTELGIEEALCGGLPLDNWEDDTLLLERVEFTYHLAHYFKPLPIRFWHVQDAFRRAGCVFSYRYRLDPMDFQWKDLSHGDEHELRTLAETLAKEGHPGVQIALRCGVPGLPRRVMQVLGLGREWLDTEEAAEVLFGETFDYGVLNWWEKKGEEKGEEDVKEKDKDKEKEG